MLFDLISVGCEWSAIIFALFLRYPIWLQFLYICFLIFFAIYCLNLFQSITRWWRAWWVRHQQGGIGLWARFVYVLYTLICLEYIMKDPLFSSCFPLHTLWWAVLACAVGVVFILPCSLGKHLWLAYYLALCSNYPIMLFLDFKYVMFEQTNMLINAQRKSIGFLSIYAYFDS